MKLFMFLSPWQKTPILSPFSAQLPRRQMVLCSISQNNFDAFWEFHKHRYRAMANNLACFITRLENELIWKINLCSIAWNCGATYIAKNANQQPNTDAIPSTQEGKSRTTSSRLFPHPFWVTSRKSQASGYISYLALFSTATSLGILTESIIWEVKYKGQVTCKKGESMGHQSFLQ